MINQEDLARRLRMEYRKGMDPFIDYLVAVISAQDRRIESLADQVRALRQPHNMPPIGGGVTL